MSESWKDIEGFEGFYQISNFGQVKSLKRTYIDKFGKKYSKKEIILRYGLSGGYNTINLCKNGDCNNYHIHRLVAQAFIPNPLNLPCINHINGMKTDNRIENLEWVTYSENTKHAFSIGLQTNNVGKGEKHNRSKLKDKDVLEIRNVDLNKTSIKELAMKYNVKYCTIYQILNKTTWQHL